MTKKRLRVTKTVPGYSPPPVDLEVAMDYDTEGRMLTLQYPSATNGAGITVLHLYDTMGRLSGLKDNSNQSDIAWGVSYGVANELLGMNFQVRTPTGLLGPLQTQGYAYNSRLQITVAVFSFVPI